MSEKRTSDGSMEGVGKKRKTMQYNDSMECEESKTVQSRFASMFPDRYEKSIFIAGEREIHFTAHIDTETIARMKKLISVIVEESTDSLVRYQDDKKVPEERSKDPDVVITYIVNSPGGSVHDVLDFVDYISILRATYANLKFRSIITGMVASAGTTMSVIADKKQMTRFAFAMIHELSTGINRTNYTRIITHADFCKDIHRMLLTVYQEGRKISMDNLEELAKLEDMLIKETWMNAEQYLALGFIDEIITGKKL